MDGDPTPALTGRRRTRPTSIGCPNPWQPEPGRAPLIAAHVAVQPNRAPPPPNEEFAASTVFKGRIAHGMLSASVISAAIANKLPGPGTIYISQNLNFKAPVRAGDTVHARVRVKEIFTGKIRVLLSTDCFVKGASVIE